VTFPARRRRPIANMRRYTVGKRVELLALLALQVAAGVPGSAGEYQYEIDGAIEQTSFNPRDGAPQYGLKARFTVFVRGSNWLIDTTEEKEGRTTRTSLRRQIGSTNGAEIFEIVAPLAGALRRTNANGAAPAAPGPSRFNMATVVSNAVPVGQLDDSVVGHLWLMMASQGYLSGLKTSLLTPVYDVSASAPGDPNLKLNASWELLGGPGSFPAQVTYFQGNRVTDAVYQVTGVTNVNGTLFPSGFLFERYLIGTPKGRVIKRASALVTAVRPACSLSSLLPTVTRDTVVADRRVAPADDKRKIVSYRVNEGRGWQPATEVKKAYESKRNSPKTRSPLLVALVAAAVCSPPLICCASHLRKRWRVPRRGRSEVQSSGISRNTEGRSDQC
jgi:hypothetical protein